MFASRGTAHSSRSQGDTYIADLQSVFRDAVQLLLNDPLMHCFKNSAESQAFMLDRIDEVIKSTVTSAAVVKLQSAALTIEDLNRQLQAVDKRTNDSRKSYEHGKDAREAGVLGERLASLEAMLEVKKTEVGTVVLLRQVHDRRHCC